MSCAAHDGSQQTVQGPTATYPDDTPGPDQRMDNTFENTQRRCPRLVVYGRKTIDLEIGRKQEINRLVGFPVVPCERVEPLLFQEVFQILSPH